MCNFLMTKESQNLKTDMYWMYKQYQGIFVSLKGHQYKTKFFYRMKILVRKNSVELVFSVPASPKINPIEIFGT